MKKLEPYVIILRRATGTVRCVVIPYQYKNIEIASDAALNLTQYSKVFKLAEPGEFMEFYNFNNQLQRPFAVYADFKCSRITSDEPGILQKHEPNSAAVRFVNTFGPSINQTWSYVGKDCVSNLITELNKLAQECIKEMQKHTKKKMS